MPEVNCGFRRLTVLWLFRRPLVQLTLKLPPPR